MFFPFSVFNVVFVLFELFPAPRHSKADGG